MDLPTVNKRIDTLVARMLSVCEEEGASLLEIRGASSRFQRVAEARIEEINAETRFTLPIAKAD